MEYIAAGIKVLAEAHGQRLVPLPSTLDTDFAADILAFQLGSEAQDADRDTFFETLKAMVAQEPEIVY